MKKMTQLAPPIVLLCLSFVLSTTEASNKDVETLIDLGYPYNNMSNYWPNSLTGFQMAFFLKGMRPAGYWYQAEEIRSPVHGGTHMDAPRHFAAGQWTIDQIPVENFVARGCVINVSEKVKKDPEYTLSVSDVQDWEAEHGSLGNCIVLVNFGWGQYYYNKEYYFAGPNGTLGPHGNQTDDLHFPGLHPDAAMYFAKYTPKVFGVGLDTPSMDYGQGANFEAHRNLFSGNVYGIENVRNLDKLPAKVDEIVVLPQNIEGSGGAPVRILARIRKPTTNDDPNAALCNLASKCLIAFAAVALKCLY